MLVRGHGGIGRHDGLKIRCLVIVREGSSPSVPNKFSSMPESNIFFFSLYKKLSINNYYLHSSYFIG